MFAAICQSERSVLRQVILDETRLTDSELSECKVQGLQLRAADLTGTNCFKTYFSGTDLTDTEIGNNPVKDFAELRGALITPYQAGGLVKLHDKGFSPDRDAAEQSTKPILRNRTVAQ